MNKQLISYFSVLLTVILVGLCIFSCSKRPTDSDTTPDYPEYNTLLDGVTFEPSSGAPGTIISMVGLDSLPADSGFSLTIGDEPAPLIVESGQTVRTAIPLYIDTTVSSWPITPSGSQRVVLLYNGVAVDTAVERLTVDSLLPAPIGTMDSVMVKLSSGASALKQIAVSIDAGDTLLMATCDAMDELLYTGTYSLTALLNGTAPVDGYDSSSAELFSALLVHSGLVDVINKWSDTLVVTARIAREFSIKQSSADFLTDKQLAARMQLHDLLAGFGSQVIGQTALDWQIASGIIGAVALAAPVVGVYEFIVSWVLGELDFIINKIAIAMLPSDVTALDLDFYNHEINTGDTTEAIVHISAKNNPPNITPADIIGQVLGGLQLTQWIQDRLGPTAARTLRSIIQDVVNWVLGVITNFLTANYNSPTSLDVALPQATWDSVWVHEPGMIDLVIPDLSKMGYMTGSFNGQAKDSIGPIGLQMRTQPGGPSTWVHPLLQAVGYAGGAFGDDLTTSNIDTVTIVGELALEIDFANTITVGGANVLGINAGYLDRNGTPHWAPDIDISLSVTDGSADVTSGVTDAQGHFSSIITMDSTADSVTVHIFAYGEYNSQSDTVVVANVETDGKIAFICDKGGAVGLWMMNEDGTNLTLLTSIDYVAESVNSIGLLSSSPDGNYIALWGRYLKDPYAYLFPYSSQMYVVPSSGTGTLRRVGYNLADILHGSSGTLYDGRVWFQGRDHTVLYEAFEKQRLPEPSVMFEENAMGGRVGLGPTPYSPNSPNPDFPLNVDVRSPVSSHDGSQIAFFSGNEAVPNVSICNADGTNQHIIGTYSESGGHSLFWTKDNNYVVAVVNAYASVALLYPASASGGIGTEIISGSGEIRSPEYFHTLADAFAYIDITGAPNSIPEGSIKFYSFEDHAVHNVMSNVHTWDITLSPNDRKIAYADAALGGDIFTVDIETGTLTQLTNENIGARKIVWYSKQP